MPQHNELRLDIFCKARRNIVKCIQSFLFRYFPTENKEIRLTREEVELK
ncbi:MAG: hypothetical protein LBI55_02750 [Oscillospiraceae bacterium]|nr:hypothetical protein [Oscillospiraceae bacterium]